jgi:uncharacterized HAD superfamily protein
MRIGIDFDDVILDLTPELLRYTNARYGTDFTFEGHFSFHLDEVWGVSRTEAIRRVNEFVFSPLHQTVPAISGAPEVLRLLRQKHELFLVTGRTHEQEHATHAWINEHIPDLFTSMTFTNLFSESPHATQITKADVCDALELDYFIEDAVLHTEIIAKTNTHVYLFDRPWNRTVSHENMTRIYGWDDIQKRLLP